ncbi:MAG: ABC transporter ATP-binding protein [Fimbriimonas sp.]
MQSPSDIAVSVRGLSKAYTIAHHGQKHVTLAEQMLSRLRRPFQRAATETFWALKDVEFDIKKGDVVGIIGRNGAGKSTLLKILSRITEPTTGEIRLYGRIGSLLEVGTGFHPELTGRENIYLNGQILGMRRKEIDKQFDAIVDFAGVEKFLDTPVKRYSSGMYVRLAFAVAAHLESEILIVDEVLAVGDGEFQKRCLGKMKDVATSGRTVLFVSHSMQAVSTLCDKTLMLHEGGVGFSGGVRDGVSRYLDATGTTFCQPGVTGATRPGSGEYRFVFAEAARACFDPVDDKIVRFAIRRQGNPLGQIYVSALMTNAMGIAVAQFDSRLVGTWLSDAGAYAGELCFRSPWPKPGAYQMDLYICAAGGIIDRLDAACRFEVSDRLPYPFASSSDGYQLGTVLPDFSWQIMNCEASGNPDYALGDSR